VVCGVCVVCVWCVCVCGVGVFVVCVVWCCVCVACVCGVSGLCVCRYLQPVATLRKASCLTDVCLCVCQNVTPRLLRDGFS